MEVALEPETTRSIAIKSTIMSIREHLMDYYKDTGLRYTIEGNIQRVTDRDDMPSRPRHYQVRNLQLRDKQGLYIGRTQLMQLEKNPHKLNLFMRTFRRSPEMVEVYTGIRRFLDKFLQGVEVILDDRGTPGPSPDDLRLVLPNHPTGTAENRIQSLGSVTWGATVEETIVGRIDTCRAVQEMGTARLHAFQQIYEGAVEQVNTERAVTVDFDNVPF